MSVESTGGTSEAQKGSLEELRNKAIVAIISAVIGGIFGVVIKPYVEQSLEAKKTPVLTKTVEKTDLSTVTDEVRKQITVLPIHYKLQHASGGEAKKIRITITGSADIPADQILFSPTSENHVTSQKDKNTVIIEVESIRPKGTIAFEYVSSKDNNIKFSELVGEGNILTESEFLNQSDERENLYIAVLVAIVSVILLIVSVFALFFLSLLFKWVADPGSSANYKYNKYIKRFISIIVIYTVLADFLDSILSDSILRLPTFPITGLFYGLALYFFVTRLDLIQFALIRGSTGIESGSRSGGARSLRVGIHPPSPPVARGGARKGRLRLPGPPLRKGGYGGVSPRVPRRAQSKREALEDRESRGENREIGGNAGGPESKEDHGNKPSG